MFAKTVSTTARRASQPRRAIHVLTDFISTPQHKLAVSTAHRDHTLTTWRGYVSSARWVVKFVSKETILWYVQNVPLGTSFSTIRYALTRLFASLQIMSSWGWSALHVSLLVKHVTALHLTAVYLAKTDSVYTTVSAFQYAPVVSTHSTESVLYAKNAASNAPPPDASCAKMSITSRHK